MYVLLRNQQYLTVENAQTETFVDQTVYDGETYRNSLPAGYIGRSWVSSINDPFGPSPDSPESKDDSFTGTVPFFLQKTRTLIRWSNGADVVGECWQDQFIGISSSVPRFVS